MVTKPLISDRTLRQLEGIANQSHRSTCRIGRRTESPNPRGGTTTSEPVYDSPIPCRIDPSGLSGGERLRGDRITSVGYASIAIPLGATPPAHQDVIEATTILPNGSTQVDRYEVIGEPYAQSYSVEIAFPVLKIGD